MKCMDSHLLRSQACVRSKSVRVKYQIVEGFLSRRRHEWRHRQQQSAIFCFNIQKCLAKDSVPNNILNGSIGYATSFNRSKVLQLRMVLDLGVCFVSYKKSKLALDAGRCVGNHTARYLG